MTDVGDFFNDPGYEDRMKAKDLCFDHNSLRPSNVDGRQDIIRELFGSIGDTFQIQQPFHCDYGYNIHAGNNIYINHNCVILDGAKVTMGDNVLIGPNCGIYSASHAVDPEKRFTEQCDAPITIGNNVWIGGNSVILAGVTIGDNSVIGAGSVVNKDIPTNVVAVGNPCIVIRRI